MCTCLVPSSMSRLDVNLYNIDIESYLIVLKTKNLRTKVYDKYMITFQKGEFPGLIPLINSYLSSMDVDADTHCTIQQYLKLIQKRASGELMTTAAWIRNFVQSHPAYK